MSKMWSELKYLGWVMFLGLVCLLIVFLIEHNQPEYIPFGMFEMWRKPLFLWTVIKPALGCAAILSFLEMVSAFAAKSKRPDEVIFTPGEAFWIRGTEVVVGGVIQEVVFRWLGFYTLIALFRFIPVPLQWVHEHVLLFIGRSLTGKALLPILSGETFGLWAIGAAIIVAGFFYWNHRAGNGCARAVNIPGRWYGGLYMSLVAVFYGLPAAIITRIVFGLVLVCVGYVRAKIVRAKNLI